jgi:hypothetical protein
MTSSVDLVLREGEQVCYVGSLGAGGYGDVHKVPRMQLLHLTHKLRKDEGSEVFCSLCAVVILVLRKETPPSPCGRQHSR